MKKMKGFSLLESLFAMTVATLLMAIVLLIYFAMTKNNNILDEQMTLKEKTFTLANLLENAVEKAGFIGCARLTNSFPIFNNTRFLITARNKITLSTKGVLTVRFANPNGANLIQDMRGRGTLYISRNYLFSNEDILLISDCKSADIFIAKAVLMDGDKQKIITKTMLSHPYLADAVVRDMEEDNYFIRDNVLFLKNIKQKKSALIEGIKTWQIQLNKHAGEVAGLRFRIGLIQGSSQKNWNLYVATRN